MYARDIVSIKNFNFLAKMNVCLKAIDKKLKNKSNLMIATEITATNMKAKIRFVSIVFIKIKCLLCD